MRSDLELRQDVLDQLEWEPSLDAAAVGVTSHNGVVTLTGAVKSYAEKLAAERAAERIKGVTALANDIEVRLPGVSERTDSDIAEAAADALQWKSSVPRGRINVVVSKGWLSLQRDVDWQYQKDAAFEAVHHLLGVKGVTNLIALKPRASASDIKSRIEAAFRRSAEVDAHRVQVEAHEGKVTLRGQLHSWAERQEANRTAWAAPGVIQVENLIAIAY